MSGRVHLDQGGTQLLGLPVLPPVLLPELGSKVAARICIFFIFIDFSKGCLSLY